MKVDDEICHRLEQVQDAFVAEWIFYRDDPSANADIEAYARDEIALGAVNIRHRRMTKLSRLQATWTYYSKECERQVIEYLMRRWPLDFRET